jgi:hypothetical protein
MTAAGIANALLYLGLGQCQEALPGAQQSTASPAFSSIPLG